MNFTTVETDPVDDPLALDPSTVWMSPEISLWGWGQALGINPGHGEDRFDRVRTAFNEFLAESTIDPPAGDGPVAFTSLTFAAGSPGSTAVVPKVLLARRGNRWTLTSADGAGLPDRPDTPPPPADRARYAGSSMPDVMWLEAVAEAVRRIDRGALDKVVLARDYAVWSKEPFHPPRLLRYLHARFPRCYTFRVADLVGASPELLLRRRGQLLESLVLAGSAPSFDDLAADRAAGAGLVSSPKDRWEHKLAVRSVREVLEPLVEDLAIPDSPELLRLDNVQHLATPVQAKVSEAIDTLGLVEKLHPTAAVGGTPTADAVRLIGEIEGMDRGRYSGPVGWLDQQGNGEFAIALRCAELSGARARLFAGAGIVEGSLPEDELEETRIKLSAMMGALAAP